MLQWVGEDVREGEGKGEKSGGSGWVRMLGRGEEFKCDDERL